MIVKLEVRPYTDEDEDAVLTLLASSLGWMSDAHHRAFFRWKHLENPAGRSAMWVAEVDDQIVGFRSMLRWNFVIDGEPVRAVRAVDTATSPEARGLGVFRTLTMHAIDQLTEEGVAFVFNTPNDQSRPGYLKMGWVELGSVPVAARPRGVRGAVRMARSRRPADLWSVQSAAGVPVLDAVVTATAEPSGSTGVQSRRDRAHLEWRYGGFGELGYRAVPHRGGFAVFRLRRRGHALEAAMVEALGVSDPAGILHTVADLSRADHAVRVGRPSWRHGELPIPGGGPVLTWRGLHQRAPLPLAEWQLSLGDIELL